jgi:short-subunit dehydrogenase
MQSAVTRPLALVTGASGGIGRELAKQFAEHGFDLLVAAEDDDINAAAAELHDLGARANAVQVDLRTPEGVDELWRRAQAAGRPIEAAALNGRSTVQLAKYVVRDMTARGEGRILFTSSESFVQSFVLALRNELKDTAITVTSLMPGPTDTHVAKDGFEALMAGIERVAAPSSAGSS